MTETTQAQGACKLAESLRGAYHSATKFGHPMWRNLTAEQQAPWLRVAEAASGSLNALSATPQETAIRPMFAMRVAAMKSQELQADGHRMQAILFDGGIGGAGSIEAWGKVLWGTQANAQEHVEQGAALGEAETWRVGEFVSSARRPEHVLMLAVGANQIAEYGSHPDFVRWVDAPTTAEPRQALTDAEAKALYREIASDPNAEASVRALAMSVIRATERAHKVNAPRAQPNMPAASA